MGKIQLVLLAFVGAALAGCGSPKVTTPAAPTVDFHQFHQVKLIVTNSVNTAYAKEGLPMFEGLMQGRLQSFGYTLVAADPELVVNVTVRQFAPGDRALRWVIGFGAGRAALKYSARFQDPTGKLLAELQGGKAYHGLELNEITNFKSNESLRMGLTSYSVSQIGQFMEGGGK